MFQLEGLLIKLMDLGFRIELYEEGKFYRVILKYKNLSAGTNVPKGDFKENIYKALVKMSDAMFFKAGG